MTRDEVIDMAKEAGFTAGEIAWHDNMFEAFAKLVADKEREACAKVCDGFVHNFEDPSMIEHAAVVCANAIRARGRA